MKREIEEKPTPKTEPTQSAEEFEIEDGVLIKYCGTAAEVTIPQGVTWIGGGAFRGCTCLRRCEFPDSLKSIAAEVIMDSKVYDRSCDPIGNSSGEGVDVLRMLDGTFKAEGYSYIGAGLSGAAFGRVCDIPAELVQNFSVEKLDDWIDKTFGKKFSRRGFLL